MLVEEFSRGTLDKGTPKTGKILAFSWYGGKFSHLNWLLPLLPKCDHYVEPFGGSAAVLLNREKSPIETYNDLDGGVVNFFRVLRESPEELIRLISLTPWSREEFALSLKEEEGLGPIEKARRFYVRIYQGFFSKSSLVKTGSWSHDITDNKKTRKRKNKIPTLYQVANRFLEVQIEHRPAISVITMYDTPNTFFYVDPPYLMETRKVKHGYALELTFDEHRELATALNNCKGMVALSGYDHPIMEELYPSDKWLITKEKVKFHSFRGSRQECLWTNYEPSHSLNKLF
jgi:DNA adenine methylase